MIFVYGIIFAYILFSIYHLFSSQYVANWMKKEKRKKIELNDIDIDIPDVVIIIPALREVSLVEDTLKYFSQIKYPKEKYKIVFVTTIMETISKEEKRKNIDEFYKKISLKKNLEEIVNYNEGLFPLIYLKDVERIISANKKGNEIRDELYKLYDSIPTTRDCIAKTIEANKERYRNYYIVECSKAGVEVGKPTQLNYVIDGLHELLGDINKERLLIGVYDFDSRPDLRTLSYIALKEHECKKQGRELPDFYQQTQLPYKDNKNIDIMSKNKNLMKANVIMYTRRALGIEIFKIMRYKKHLERGHIRFMRPIINCLGAGMFIEENTLREIGGFAEPVEDLVLGYKLNIKNKRVEPLPYINIMQPYLYMKEMINSHSRIFMIGLRLYREGTYIESDKIQSIIPAIKEFCECIMWLLCCPIMWTAFICYFTNGFIIEGMALLICTILLRFWVDFIILAQEAKNQIMDYEGIECNIEISRKQMIIMLILSPFLGIVRFVSALVGGGKFIYFYVLHKKTYRKKTER